MCGWIKPARVGIMYFKKNLSSCSRRAMWTCCTQPEVERVSVKRPKEALGKAWWADNVTFAVMEDSAVLWSQLKMVALARRSYKINI